MSYELAFKESALQEWHKLDGSTHYPFQFQYDGFGRHQRLAWLDQI